MIGTALQVDEEEYQTAYYYAMQDSTLVNPSDPDDGSESRTRKDKEPRILHKHSPEPVQSSVETRGNSKTDTQAGTDESTPVIPVETDSMLILASMLRNEDVESGISNPSETYVDELLQKDPLGTMNGLCTLFMNNFKSSTSEKTILVGVLHMISHFDYQRVYPIGQTMAIAALSHKDREVEEFAIKCFENWENPDAIDKLSAIRFSTSWLQEYADAVIRDLSEG